MHVFQYSSLPALAVRGSAMTARRKAIRYFNLLMSPSRTSLVISSVTVSTVVSAC